MRSTSEATMHTIQGKWVNLPVSDGTSMRAYVARPTDLATAPALLVFQEIFGVNGHIREICERFAMDGFTAMAPELFHRTAPGFITAYDNHTPGQEEAAKLAFPDLEEDFRAAADWFAADSQTGSRKLGSIGFCMGGRMSFLAATTLPLACSACFYGGNIPQHLDRLDHLQSPLLLVWGAKDEGIPPEQRQALEDALLAAKKSYLAVCFEEAGHGFFCDQRASYDSDAARLAWPLALDFLRKYLDPDARE